MVQGPKGGLPKVPEARQHIWSCRYQGKERRALAAAPSLRVGTPQICCRLRSHPFGFIDGSL